jgi:hypothetical protein
MMQKLDTEGHFVVAAAGGSAKHYSRHWGTIDVAGYSTALAASTSSANFMFLRPAVRKSFIRWTLFSISNRPAVRVIGKGVPHQPTEFHLPMTNRLKVSD